jgi:hypothetical protein
MVNASERKCPGCGGELGIVTVTVTDEDGRETVYCNIGCEHMTPLVKVVKEHALAHYNDGGWDVIVECWEDSEIAQVIREKRAATPEQAIGAFQTYVAIVADREADALNSAF